VVEGDDEVLVVMESGMVVRSPVSGVPSKGRDTMGVIFAKPRKKDRILKVARNSGAALAVAGEDISAETVPAESESPEPDDAVALVPDEAVREEADQDDA